jgi:hypothetical protein
VRRKPAKIITAISRLTVLADLSSQQSIRQLAADHRRIVVDTIDDFSYVATCWDKASVRFGTHLRERIINNGTQIIVRSQ